MKDILQLYNKMWIFVLFVPLFLCLAGQLSGCGAMFKLSETERAQEAQRVLAAINKARSEANLPPLALDPLLSQSAQTRAETSAASGKAEPEKESLTRIVNAGGYARFALSHEVKTKQVKQVGQALIQDPIGKSKAIHPSLTHLGIGFAQSGTSVYVVMDLARLTPAENLPALAKDMLARIAIRRKGNSVDPLAVDADLNTKAEQVAQSFIRQNLPSEHLLESAQADLNSENFRFGRVLVSFQVAADGKNVVIPNRISDPALAHVGVGLAQGNHKNHDAGALAVVIIMAEPQTAHTEQRKLSHLPSPKAAPRAQRARVTGSLVDQAWVAALAGNHPKSANLFEQSYRSTKNPQYLYEAARAHARNDDTDKALKLMRQFVELASGEEKAKANKMVGQLERGESIFTQSKEQKMSVEAQKFLMIGQRLFEQSEWNGAIDAFQQAYTYAKHPDIIYNIGLTHCRAGRIGEALDYFAEYHRIVPQAESLEQARQLFQIGLELYQIGQFETASRHFAMAYGQLPIPDLIYNLALCHKGMGNKDEAIRLLREFIGTGPAKADRREAENLIRQLSR